MSQVLTLKRSRAAAISKDAGFLPCRPSFEARTTRISGRENEARSPRPGF
jgi:hypothetical protein